MGGVPRRPALWARTLKSPRTREELRQGVIVYSTFDTVGLGKDRTRYTCRKCGQSHEVAFTTIVAIPTVTICDTCTEHERDAQYPR